MIETGWQRFKRNWLRVLVFLILWAIISAGFYHLLMFVPKYQTVTDEYGDQVERRLRLPISLGLGFGLTALGFYLHFKQKKRLSVLMNEMASLYIDRLVDGMSEGSLEYQALCENTLKGSTKDVVCDRIVERDYPPKSLIWINRVLRQDPKSLKYLWLKAKVLQRSGSANEAIETYEQIIAIDEKNLDAYTGIVDAYVDLDSTKDDTSAKIAKMVRLNDMVIQVASSREDYTDVETEVTHEHAEVADALKKMGRYKAAIAFYERHLSLIGEKKENGPFAFLEAASTHRNLGEAFAELGSHPEAFSHHDKALEYCRKMAETTVSPRGWEDRAALQSAYYERYRINISVATSCNKLGKYEEVARALDEATRLIEKIEFLNLNSYGNREEFLRLGMVYETKTKALNKLRRYRQALQCCEEAIERYRTITEGFGIVRSIEPESKDLIKIELKDLARDELIKMCELREKMRSKLT